MITDFFTNFLLLFRIKYISLKAYLILLLMVPLGISAQTTVIIGANSGANATTTYPCPLGDYYTSQRAQYLYTAAELTAAGITGGSTITNLGWIANATAITGHSQPGFTISLKNAALANLTAATWEAGLTTVYGPTTYNYPSGFAGNITFLVNGGAGFTYTGGDLVVEVCHTYAATFDYTLNPAIQWTTGLTGVKQHTYRADNVAGCATTAVTNTGTATVRPRLVLSYIASTPCSGTPNPGNTLSTANPACPATSITLSLTNPTMGSGVSYQWQSSPDGITWTNISGATFSTYTTTQSVNTYYQCIVTCSAGSTTATSTPLLVTMNTIANCYCNNTNTTSTAYYINSFSTTNGLTNITNNNSVFSTGGYGNFTAQSASQIQGSTVNFSITGGPAGYTYGFGIWIDYNQDGTFGAGENVYNSAAYLASATGTFTVPVTALPGGTRMRVVSNYLATSPTACTGTGYTECEDYTFIVLSPPPAPPAPTNITASPTCVSGVTLTATGTPGTGVTWYWQGTNPLGTDNSSGANASSPLTVYSNATYYIRAYNSSTALWSTTSGAYTVTTIPVNPATAPAIVSSNGNPACATTNISSPTAVAGDYWQTIAAGTSTASPATIPYNGVTTAGTYYIRSQDVSGCWSAPSTYTLNVLPSISTTAVATQIATCGGTTGTIAIGSAYNNNFSTANLGNATIYGNASIIGGVLQLTPNLLNQGGAIVITDPNAINSNAMTIDFDLITIGAQGADGASYSFGDDVVMGIPTTPTTAESGSGTKFKISFDAYTNGANTNGIYLMYNCNVASPTPTTPGVLGYVNNVTWCGGVTSHVTITIDNAGLATVKLGATTLFSNIPLGAGYLAANKATWKHAFAARTGAITQGHQVDNLNVMYGYAVSPLEYSFDNAATWGTSNTASVVPGTYNTWVRYSANPSCAFSAGTVTITPFAVIPGTTTSTIATPCVAANFTLSLTGATTGTGLTYQWQSSPSGLGGTWTDIVGAMAATLTTSQTVATYYHCLVTCSGLTAPSTTLFLDLGSSCQCAAYCTSAATTTADEEIFNVTVGSLNNTSTCATTGGTGSTLNMYSNYAGIITPPNLTVGSTVPFSIEIGTCGGNFTSGTAIFIDFNANGNFTDPGENVYVTTAGTNGPHFVTGSFVVPLTATNGITRMRIINAEGYAGTTLTPCLSPGYGETEDYCVNVVVLPCSGMPTPGNTVSSIANACSATNFTLSMSTSPSGIGLTYQWESSTNGTTWTPITGATSMTLTTSQTVATYYHCIVTCTNSGLTATSNDLQVGMGSSCQCVAYCASAATVAADEEIFNVTVGSLNNTSTCATTGGPGSTLSLYSNYAGIITPPNLMVGSTVPFSIQIGTCGGNFTSGTAIFIDFNANGNFTDPGEAVYVTTAGTNGPHFVTGSFVVPLTATNGITRMRIINAEGYAGTTLTPCLSPGYGETEDYCVNIVSLPCTGTPTPGNTLSTANPVCDNSNFTLSMSTPPVGLGLTYQWESSPNGTTWTPIAGATAMTLTTSQTAVTYYHCVVTCTNSGLTGTSTPLLIGSTANAGPDAAICASGGSTTLNGSTTVSLSSTLTVIISGTGFLDEVSWTMTNSASTVIGSGGTYLTGSTNTSTVTVTSPPVSFFLEANGTFNDNTANYQIICNGTTIASGTVAGTGVGGITGNITVPNLSCSSSPTYTWSPATALSDPNIANPVASPTSTTTYTLTTNAGGCIGTDQVTVSISNVTLGVSSQTNVNCFGGNTGNVTVVAVGGATPYQYSINGGTYQPGSSFFNLTQGTYTIDVKDANNCTASTNVTITEPASALTVGTTTVQDVSCNGGTNGSITLVGSGGTAPYQYQINGGAYSNSGTFSGLAAGTYTLGIKDAYLCTYTFTLPVSEPLTAVSGSITAQTNVLCYGANTGSVTVSGAGGVGPYQYAINGGTYQSSGTFNTLSAVTYTVTVMDFNTCTTNVTVNIGQPSAGLSATIAGTNVLCFGNSTGDADLTVTGGTLPYTYTWSNSASSEDLNGVIAGTYNVTVNDASLCSTSASVTITEPTAALLVAETHIDALCFGGNGSVTISATGGTLPYTGTGTFVQVAGTQSYTVTDGHGCSNSISVTVGQPSSSVVADAGADVTLCLNSSTTLMGSATGGTSPYTYAWDNGATQGGNVSPAATTTYTLTVTDFNGCTDTDDMIVTINSVPIVAAPSIGTTYIADYESTDAFGWTHYYDDNGTMGATCDDYLLLSLKKTTNTIGTIGDGTFQVTLGATLGAVHITNPPANYVTALDWYVMNRYWWVTPTFQPSTDVPVRFYYTTPDFDAVNNSPASAVSAHTDLKFYKINGTGYNPDPSMGHAGVPAAAAYNQSGYWQYNNGSAASTTDWTYVSVGGNTHYAEYVVGSFSGGGGGGGGNGGAFPVEVVNFSGYEYNAENILTWITGNEANNLGFKVLKSIDNVSYMPLEMVPSKAPNGTSNTSLSYQFIDKEPASTTYYRLMQIDIDGGTHVHNQTVEITRTGETNAIVLLYPNPAKEELNVSITNPVAKKYTLKVYDVQGKLVMTQKEMADEGLHICKLNISKLAKGAYSVIVIDDVNVSSHLFIKE